MSAERARLLDLAASVADGTANINWDALESSLQDDDDRQLLRDLKVLAGVAEVHRAGTSHVGVPGSSKVVGRIRPVADHDLPTIEERVLRAPERGPIEHWGHLALLEQIGQGSFGHVYRAHDTRLDRDVALKLLRPGRRTSELAGKMLHEGRILAKVRHRNVVTVFGVEECDGRVGLWMEYIRGRTLEQLLRSQGAFGAREVALIGQELCRALAAVHKAGLVHRDIKAQNVMREEGGRLVLMDFGAGQVVQADGAPSSGRLTGTPLYLAPELLRGEDATVQSDIYSLGVVLFHLVTSQYPVSAASLDDLRQAHAEERRLRLHDARPDVADEVARVVERALQPDPRRRYASAGAMQDALARSLGLDSTITVERAIGPSGEAPSTPPSVADGKARVRRWWTVAAAGFALGAALAAGLGLVWPGSGSEPVVRRAAVRVPVVAVRPMAEAIADPLTAALATDVAQALRTSADVRVTSEEAVRTLNRPGDLSIDIMGALQADALVEVLPVSRRSDGGLYANVRVIMAGAMPATIVPDGPSADLPALTERILDRLAPRLRIDAETLRPLSARSQLGAAHPEASQRFMRGSWLLAQGANEVLPDAAVEFHAALTLDPEFAPAYARWAQTLLRRYRAGQITAVDAFDRVRTAVAQSLARDAENSDAFAVAGDLRAEEERNWVRAEDDFLRAIALNPSNEYARTRYAMLLSGRGRSTEAVDQMEEALRLAPLSSTLQGYLGMTLHYAGRDEEALRLFEQLHKVDRGWGATVVGLCRVYTAVGKYAEAATACTEVERRKTEQQAFVDAQRTAILAGQGRTREARVIAESLARRYRDAPPDERADLAFYTAVAQVALRQFDQAFLWLDTAMDARSSRLLYVRIDPRFTALRSDPRFANLVARVDHGL